MLGFRRYLMSGQAIRAISWMFIGMIVAGAATWILMPSMMLAVHKSPHDYQGTVELLNNIIRDKQDWKAPSTYDFQQTIHDAGHGPIEKVGAVALCNPRYASRILAADENKMVTAFMPLGIGVYEDANGDVYISELNVGLLGMMFGGTIAEVMADAGNDVGEIIAAATAE